MKHSRRPAGFRLLAISSLAACAGFAAPAFSQQQRQQQPSRPARNAPAQPPSAAPSTGGGLNALNDDALIAELAGRGQESLLERAFEVNKTPPEQRAGLKALGALRELSNKQKPPTASRRQALIAQVVAGSKAVLPTIKDPVRLMEVAALLITEGSDPLLNLLEYWGENPVTQARLRPIAETVVSLYEQAAAEADAAKAEVEKRIAGPNDRANAERWTRLDELSQIATLTRHMTQYELALGMPQDGRADGARAKVIETALESLKQYDTPDSNVQPEVRIRTAKLLMLKGEFGGAKEVFQTVSQNKGLAPVPDVYQQYQARYFSAVCDMQSGDTAAARAALGELLKWQRENLPGTPDAQKRAAAAAEMMQYRIYLAESQKAKAAGKAEEARKAEEAAVAVLTKLSNERPELRGIISDQLIDRVGVTKPVKELDVMLLRALMQKGLAEREKPAAEQADAQTLGRAVEAAEEIVRRKGSPGVDDTLVEAAALTVPRLLERSGRKVEAANRYLDFMDQYPRSQQRQAAFAGAGNLIAGDLRSGPDRGKAEVVAVWKRFLPVAINPPFNYLNYAYDYADRLRLDRQYREAAEYYARVPSTEKRHPSAKYFQVVSLFSLLFDTRTENGRKVPAVQGEARKQLAAEVLRLAEEAKKVNADAMAKAKDDRERAARQLWVAGAGLTMAEVAALEQNDPQRTLSALATFEQDVKGLAEAREMLNRALYLRVQSLMSAGRFDDATAALVSLQNQTGGQQGAEIIFDLLNRLDADFDKAEDAGDADKMRTLAQNRAKLSGFLVERARTSSDSKLKSRVYSYSVYDAESKRRAGTLAKDQRQLRDALAAFQRLLSPDMLAMYRQESESNPRIDPNYPPPNVLMGIGLTSFELGDFGTAQENLGRLLIDKKLGSPALPKVDERTNETTYVDNAPYWEATYKLLRSNVELHKQNPGDLRAREAYENTKGHLKRLYIRGNVGGEKWNDEFESLRREIIPEFDPKTVAPADAPPAAEDAAPAPAPPAQ